jgi:pimeloyl-ACP methyl ester carboxylesterase/DNA-binding CsgD family transcriptional regulator
MEHPQIKLRTIEDLPHVTMGQERGGEFIKGEPTECPWTAVATTGKMNGFTSFGSGISQVEQSVASAHLSDGTSVAYATAGAGPPLLLVGGWLSHLELSWALLPERSFLEALASGRTLVRYDRPGCGLSDRSREIKWSPALERETLDTVMSAIGGATFDLVGSSLGVPIAIDWAARHPETVDRLVLYGGWARGEDVAAPQVREHVVGLIRSHWGLGSEVLTEIFAPEASTGTRSVLADYQRQASSAETAADLLLGCYEVDVVDRLKDVTAPTLVLHREQDRAAPLEQSRLIASRIEGARLIELPGRSHLPFIGDVDSLVSEIRRFLGLPSLRQTAAPTLTKRQGEVADLVSQGLTNRDIAQQLGIDERSAEGHVERIRIRLGVRSRAQIATWWVTSNAPN